MLINTFWQIKNILNFFLTIFGQFDIFDNFEKNDIFWQILIFFYFENCWKFRQFFTFFDKFGKFYNPGDLWHLRHRLQFLQLWTWIHDNLCYLTIKSDCTAFAILAMFCICIIVSICSCIFLFLWKWWKSSLPLFCIFVFLWKWR